MSCQSPDSEISLFCLDLDEPTFLEHTFRIMVRTWISLQYVLLNIFSLTILYIEFASAATNPSMSLTPPPISNSEPLARREIRREIQDQTIYTPVNESPHFDLPITYNSKVKFWIKFFQNNGKRDFKLWLERSNKYFPKITPVLQAQGLPQDLVYLAMIESGFSPRAVSSANAVGYWQFMKGTAERYGLKVDWWIDERRDIIKSTVAAANYLNDLYKMFDSWYLAAAAYNMGEGRVKRLIKKYKTTNYWVLSKKSDFPSETEQYIPKLIAAIIIAKAPQLYGFRDLQLQQATSYDEYYAPGGLDLESLSLYLNLDKETLNQMNPEIVKGFIPTHIQKHKIRIPSGRIKKVKQYANSSLVMSN